MPGKKFHFFLTSKRISCQNTAEALALDGKHIFFDDSVEKYCFDGLSKKIKKNLPPLGDISISKTLNQVKA